MDAGTFDASTPQTVAEIEAVAKFEAAFAANDPAAMIEISRSMEFRKAVAKTAFAAAIAMCKKNRSDPQRIAYLFHKSFADELVSDAAKKIRSARFRALERRIAELEKP